MSQRLCKHKRHSCLNLATLGNVQDPNQKDEFHFFLVQPRRRDFSEPPTLKCSQDARTTGVREESERGPAGTCWGLPPSSLTLGLY